MVQLAKEISEVLVQDGNAMYGHNDVTKTIKQYYNNELKARKISFCKDSTVECFAWNNWGSAVEIPNDFEIIPELYERALAEWDEYKANKNDEIKAIIRAEKSEMVAKLRAELKALEGGQS